MTSPAPEPNAATTMPPSGAPTMLAALLPSRLTALACLRISGGTVWGSSADAAGADSDAARPLTTLTVMSSGIVAVCVMISTPAAPWLRPATVLAPTMSRPRGSRSAITPPKSRNRICGTVRAPTTSPRSPAEPVMSSTANANAIGAIEPPTCDTTLAANTHRKGA